MRKAQENEANVVKAAGAAKAAQISKSEADACEREVKALAESSRLKGLAEDEAVDPINIYGGDGLSKILDMSQESLKQGLDMLCTMGIDVPDLLNHISGNKSDKIEYE